MESQINLIKQKVNALLGQENSGHDMAHVNRVLALSLNFAKQEVANPNIVSLIALLHDVDDYKLFGHDTATNLPNARCIMQEAEISPDTQTIVCNEIKHLGYSKRLQGLRPRTLEGKIVSDADMCDGLGAHGIIRTCQYSAAHQRPFFRLDLFPLDELTVENYASNDRPNSSINHVYEKILLLKNLMLTPSGKHEAEARHNFTVNFLRQFFQEENATDWLNYLDNFLTKNGGTDRN